MRASSVLPRVTLLALLSACASAPAPPPASPPASPRASTGPEPTAAAPPPAAGAPYAVGKASWYGAALAGHRTASGERFDPEGMTAAHRTLKMGTWVEVRRTDNGRIVRVRINDRGPVSHRLLIDLSHGAAERLGMVRMGIAPVELRIVRGP